MKGVGEEDWMDLAGAATPTATTIMLMIFCGSDYYYCRRVSWWEAVMVATTAIYPGPRSRVMGMGALMSHKEDL